MIKLFKHQEEARNKARGKLAFAYFLETGTGKTILSLQEMVDLKNENKIAAAIITAPKTVIKPVWFKELENFTDQLKYFIFGWVGSFTDYQAQLLDKTLRVDSDPERMPIILINIEAFSHNRIYNTVERVLRKWNTLWIIDESTTIKTPSAKRTKGILEISHLAEYKRILSGYPVLRSPEDLYSQIQFLGPNLIPQRSFFAFRNQFCILKKLDNRVTISMGPKNVDQLNQLIQGFSSRILKKDCLDLPPKLKTIRYVEMTTEQKQYYSDMKNKGFLEIKKAQEESDFVFTAILLTQLEKLHQIANGVIITANNNVLSIDCNKYEVLLNILTTEIPTQQVVVWATYVGNLDKIEGYLTGKVTCRRIRGTDKEANKIEEGFINGDFQCLICNPASFRFGHNWTNASYAIYFSNSFNLEYRIQSEDRLHRIGQHSAVTYIDLITDNTIEERIIETLEHNHSVGAAILKDEWKEWFN